MSTLRGIADLCTEAYQEDFTGAFGLLGPGVHVIARADGRIVSHAMWVVRELHAGTRPPFRTAYVEAVATRPLLQRRGFATEVLRRLAREIRDYDLGALSPSDDRYYARLGWESWRGPLSITDRRRARGHAGRSRDDSPDRPDAAGSGSRRTAVSRMAGRRGLVEAGSNNPQLSNALPTLRPRRQRDRLVNTHAGSIKAPGSRATALRDRWHSYCSPAPAGLSAEV